MQVLFQFTYTTVFGCYSAYVFTATGSLLSPILVHSFCNWMGVPDFRRMVEQAGGSVMRPLLLTTGGVAAFVILFKPLLGHP